MKYAAFFRNVNLGRPNCPTKAELEQAFAAAGASSPSSFLTNGTIVFVLAAACRDLQAGCGLREPAYVRRVDYLAELVALDPFAAVDRGSVYGCCATFLDADSMPHPALPLESKRLDVRVLRFTGGEALSVSLKVGNTAGSPNAFLEKLLGKPATTRSWNTVVRLVQRHA